MTSKERAALRAQANSLEPLFQVGKGGVNDALIAQTLDAFRSRELLKLKVLLETAPKPPREIAEEIAAKTQSEVVQVVGGSLIFFKENPELHEPKDKEKDNRYEESEPPVCAQKDTRKEARRGEKDRGAPQGGAQFQTQPRYITANFKSTGSKAGAFSPAFLCIGTNREFFVKAY